METTIVDVNNYDPHKRDIIQRYSDEDEEVFNDLVNSKILGKRFIDILKKEIDKHLNLVGIVMISTRACHAPKFHTNIEGMVYPAVQFKIPKEEYRLYKQKYDVGTMTMFYRGRRITIKFFKTKKE